jgi:CRP-like cAMP-binding protein
MAKVARAKRGSNFILAKLSPDDFALLEPNLEQINLPVRMSIEQRKKPVQHVYFVDNGIISVVANGDMEIEVGVIGREGMTGVSIILGEIGPAVYQTYVQVAGSGRRMKVAQFRVAMSDSPTLTKTFLRHANSFLGQVTQTALANARGTLDQRLSRWLLMVNDRVDGDVVPLTHEFLSVMLGVNRPGVTLALKELERTGAITQRRGSISIVDCATLESIAASNYVKP